MPCDANDTRIGRLAAAFLSTTAMLFWAGPLRAEVVTLKSLEHKAVARRATVDAERARQSRARAQVELARASRLPSLSFDADGAVAPGNSLISVFDTTGHEYRVLGSRPLGNSGAFSPEPRYSAALKLGGTLYDFGRSSQRIDAAEAGSRAASANVDAARASVVRNVQHAYLDWVLAVAAEKIAQRSADNARARQKAVAGYVDEGKRPPSDLLSARVEVSQARLDLVEARGRVTTARLEVERAAAVSLSATAQPDSSLLDAKPPRTQPGRAPALTALERRRDAARASARSHDHRWAPVLSGVAEAGIYGQKATVFPSYRVGLKLSVPLWDGGIERARRDVARATAAELSAETSDLDRSLSHAEATARAEWRNAARRVQVAQEFQRAAKAALDAAQARYELGDGSVEDVIRARAQNNQATLRLLHARAARTDAVLRLRALGAGQAAR